MSIVGRMVVKKNKKPFADGAVVCFITQCCQWTYKDGSKVVTLLSGQHMRLDSLVLV